MKCIIHGREVIKSPMTITTTFGCLEEGLKFFNDWEKKITHETFIDDRTKFIRFLRTTNLSYNENSFIVFSSRWLYLDLGRETM